MSLEAKATQLQFRGDTTAKHATFTGKKNEITVDEDKKIPVVHDGETPGGNPIVPVPLTSVILWNQANAMPTGWKICDGTDGTPNMGSIATTDSKTMIYIMAA